MKLPEIKEKKLIKEKEFVKVAKKVRESMEDEAKYLHKKKTENGNDSNPLNILNFY
ncbi:MAG TPA: hypothetical protein VFI61_03550 [Patescibacteria group bacterium]|nr:hypothetical protein [Patescibacteria group bacterium]